MRPTTATDVVVTGGGLAGLAAATFLARAGRRVTLERFSESVAMFIRTTGQNSNGMS